MNPLKPKKDLILNSSMAYIAGVFAGDGHISNKSKSKNKPYKDYRMSIELTDHDFLKLVESMIKEFIETRSSVKKVKQRVGKSQSWVFQFRNRDFYKFLVDVVGLPTGSKNNMVLPESIKNSSKNLKANFLAGFFDTDGGFRGETIGFTMSSESFQKDVSQILDEFKVSHINERWLNKKYKSYYYGIKIKRSNIKIFLNECPLRNEGKLKKVSIKFCGVTKVAKWDRGF